jgi:hypothetical protein
MSLNRRTISRRDTSESPLGTTNSFRLVAADNAGPDTIDNIRDFESFKRLRKVYQNLCELPETLFADWITCCTDHIAKDIDGKNTQEENYQNVRIGALFDHFRKRYTIALDEESNAEKRHVEINDALLELLRSLLGKPCRLADELLAMSGFPSEEK